MTDVNKVCDSEQLNLNKKGGSVSYAVNNLYSSKAFAGDPPICDVKSPYSTKEGGQPSKINYYERSSIMEQINKQDNVFDFEEEDGQELSPITITKDGDEIKVAGSLEATVRRVLGIGNGLTRDLTDLRTFVDHIVGDLRRGAIAHGLAVVTVIFDLIIRQMKSALSKLTPEERGEICKLFPAHVSVKDGVETKITSTNGELIEYILLQAKNAQLTIVKLADIFGDKVDLDKCTLDARLNALIKYLGGKH